MYLVLFLKWLTMLLFSWFCKQLFIAIIFPWFKRPLAAASRASTKAAVAVGVA